MNNHYFVYMLECSDGSYYIGHTNNLETRLSEHKIRKHSGYTAARLPVKLVYHALFSTRDEAFTAERQIKGWSRKKKEALIRNDWEKIIELSNQKLSVAHALRQAQDDRRED